MIPLLPDSLEERDLRDFFLLTAEVVTGEISFLPLLADFGATFLDALVTGIGRETGCVLLLDPGLTDRLESVSLTALVLPLGTNAETAALFSAAESIELSAGTSFLNAELSSFALISAAGLNAGLTAGAAAAAGADVA